MIDFPKSTVVNRRIPKEAFYKHLPLSAALKSRFVSDIESIIVSNSLTKDNLNLAQDSEIKEIILLTMNQKKLNIDRKIMEEIARQNSHKLIFMLVYENQYQLAVYKKKLYLSQWMKETELSLSLSGNTLKEIWEDLVRQIAISSQVVLERNDQTIDEQLQEQDEINRLDKLIRKTEVAAWKEQQPKKRFELYQKVQRYKKELEEITDGQT